MFSFGSDVEFMLEKNGRFYSAIGIINGTKEERLKVDQHEFYYDNVLAECATKPSQSKAETIDNFRSCLQAFVKLASPYQLTIRASKEYPENQLNHKEALEIGCTPEKCAYTWESLKPDPSSFANNRLRTAGGHIHVGGPIAQANRRAMALMFDLFVGIPSVFLDRDPTSKTRRKLYGEPGRYREPDHGFEYRTLSNFWWASPRLVEIIYDLSKFTTKFVGSDGVDSFWTVDQEFLDDVENWKKADFHPSQAQKCHGYDALALRKAIKNQDRVAAMPFMKIVKKHLPDALYKEIMKESRRAIPNFYKEWDLC